MCLCLGAEAIQHIHVSTIAFIAAATVGAVLVVVICGTCMYVQRRQNEDVHLDTGMQLPRSILMRT